MWLFGKKKIPNPEIKQFEEYLVESRGFILVKNVHLGHCDIIIQDKEEFVKFAKRCGVRTIFVETSYGDNVYFYLADGKIIRSYRIKREIRK